MLQGSRLFCSSTRNSRRRHQASGDGGGDARAKPRYGHKTTVNFLANLIQTCTYIQGDIICQSSHFRQLATHFQIKLWKSCKFQTTFTQSILL